MSSPTGERTNTWDSQNLLRQCTYGNNTSTFTYGADGLRRSTTMNDATTYYALDGQNVAEGFEVASPSPHT